jgi:hypothetical protein
VETSKLAGKMLEWERKKQELDALADEIAQAVLAVGKTQTAGNVRAIYKGGRKSYNYQEAADGHPMVSTATVELFTRFIPAKSKIDWKKICDHAGIDDVPFKQGEPSVTLKTLE